MDTDIGRYLDGNATSIQSSPDIKTDNLNSLVTIDVSLQPCQHVQGKPPGNVWQRCDAGENAEGSSKVGINVSPRRECGDHQEDARRWSSEDPWGRLLGLHDAIIDWTFMTCGKPAHLVGEEARGSSVY